MTTIELFPSFEGPGNREMEGEGSENLILVTTIKNKKCIANFYLFISLVCKTILIIFKLSY